MQDSTAPERSELKATLRRYGVLQREVAECIGVSETTIVFWFKGELSSPKLDAAIPAYVAGLERAATTKVA